MSNQMSEAMKSAKTIQQEMVQWENRLENVRQEANNLKRQNETLDEQMALKRSDFQTYIASRETELRQGFSKLAEDQQTLEAQRNEFKASLEGHLKDKQDLAQKKVEDAREKVRADGRRHAIEEFIQAVRRAYNVLPD
jgi:chromosome segregation ATPase